MVDRSESSGSIHGAGVEIDIRYIPEKIGVDDRLFASFVSSM